MVKEQCASPGVLLTMALFSRYPSLGRWVVPGAVVASLACNGAEVSGLDLSCRPSAFAFPATASGTIAYVNVNVLPMDGGPYLRDQTVLIEGDRITRVGPVAEVRVPDGAVQLDGTCRVLMPGLTDMHVHLGYTTELVLLLANGVTTVREMWGGTGHLDLRDEIARGEVLGPTMIVGSTGLRATVFMGRTIVINDPAEADSIVASLAAAGYDFVKVHEDLTASVYDAVVAAAEQHGIAVAGHAPFPAGLERVLATDQTSIEHMANAFLPFLGSGGGTPSWWNAPLDGSSIEALARRLGSEGVWVTPTLATLRAMLTPEEEAAYPSRTEVRYLTPRRLNNWQEVGPWGSWRAREGAIEGESRMLKAMADAGVRLLVGTDGGFTYLMPGFTIHDELEMFVQSGLTPEETLMAATSNAAEFLGQLDEFGVVAAGRRADLLLLDADPLEDVANVKQRAGVMVRGQWLSEDELRRMLEEVADGFTAGGAPAVALGPSLHHH